VSHIFFDKLTDICHDTLYKDQKLFSYLTSRGVTASTIQKYKLGAFPRDLRVLLNDINDKELLDNGIIWNASESPFLASLTPMNKKEIYYPVVIPIYDTYGNPVAIGCRTLMEEERRKELGIPKYRNSVYEKTAHLFGLNWATEAIRKNNCVFVVEGYFDVIACHQAGVFNVVATCGTLFSKRQLVMLSRYTNNIVLLFDNDAPGHTSSRRVMRKMASDELIKVNLTCRFTPPGYKDIDEYLYRGGNLSFFTEKGDVLL